MHTAHTNDVDGVIDPSLDNNPGAADSQRESTNLPDDERALKRTWLALLPTEQVIEILMKLDESLPAESAVRREVWPGDLKAAVFRAAVAKIVESTGGMKDASTATTMTTDGKIGDAETAREEPKGPPPPATISTSATPSPALAAAAAPTPTPAPTSSTTPVPALTSTILRLSPPTSTTTYQAAAASTSFSASPASFSSYTYPYTGSIAYQHHSVNHQPYSYSFSHSHSPSLSPSLPRVPPTPGQTPGPTGTPTPIPVAVPEDEDDLPSYEEMLVQALTVHNDPGGTAPKQLFQWMAATYPLQANFRPSASQALQKAYKRGRFEKNSEGRYRLNPRWEGGNTSRRTTRRPQSYSKAVHNPSPSSHPPSNASQFPPQHYTWTYGQGRTVKSQSPAPALPPDVTTFVGAPVSGTGLSAAVTKPTDGSGAAAGDVDQDHESHKSCMEAAYSILQALNITSGIIDANANASQTNAPSICSTSTTSSAPPPSTGASTLPDTSNAPASSTTAPNTAPPPLPAPSYTATNPANRAALQGSLALLAAQLAEIADEVNGRDAAAGGGGGSTGSLVGGMSLNLLDGINLGLGGLEAFTGS